jgi:TolA-binding protein
MLKTRKFCAELVSNCYKTLIILIGFLQWSFAATSVLGENTNFDELIKNCTQTQKTNSACIATICSLAVNCFEESLNTYVNSREMCEKEMEVWEKTQNGTEPTFPTPNYKKPLMVYNKILSNYPSYAQPDEIYYQKSFSLYLLQGDIDNAKKNTFEELSKKYPNSKYSSKKHYRLTDLYILDRDYENVINHINKIAREITFVKENKQ